MASQQGPPIRPWFRLGSIVRPPAPPTQQPDLVPPPRPTVFLRPAFRVPTAPPPQEPTLPPPPSQPTQPPQTVNVAPVPPLSTVVAPPSPQPIAAPRPPSPRQPVMAAPSSPSQPAGTSPQLISARTPPSPRSPVMSPSPRPVAATQSSPQPITTTASQKSPPPSPQTVTPPSPRPPFAVAQPLPTTPRPNVVITTPPFPKNGTAPQASTPSRYSPAPKTMSPPQPPQPTSPSPAPSPKATTGTPTTTTNIYANSKSSPKIIQQLDDSPPPSRYSNLTPRSPSPLTLPPTQVHSDNQTEYQQKKVLVHETKEKPKVLHKNFNAGQAHKQSRELTKEKEPNKKQLESDELGMRIITMAGDNKGAIMELGSSLKNHDFGNNPRSLNSKKVNPTAWSDGEKSDNSNEWKSKEKQNNQKGVAPPMNAFVNCNVQGVNNSILYNSSTSHHDPGVHLSISRKPSLSYGNHLKDRKSGWYSS